MPHIEILVSKNPDQYTESFDWVLIVDDVEVACGTEYTEDAANDSSTIASREYTQTI